uniref:VWFA domain-containing protein n=1 Tax=Caenorhabditis japonica TaxID=281687 RepID=A0A8R1I809_CAEJA
MGSPVKTVNSFSEAVSAMFSSKSLWRLSNQKGNHALVYEVDGHDILVYTDEGKGVTVQNGSVPFKIKRLFATGPNSWTIVSQKNENFLLTLINDEWNLKQINNDVKGDFDTVAMKFNEQEMVVVADPYYFVHGNCGTEPEEMAGVKRRPLGTTFQKRPYNFAEEKCATNDLSREVTFLGNTVIRALPGFLTPGNVIDEKIKSHNCLGFLEAIDLDRKKICYVPIPHDDKLGFHYQDWVASITKSQFHMIPWNDEQVLTIDSSGTIRSFELSISQLSKSYDEWKRMTTGIDDESKLRMEFDRKPEDIDFSKLDEPKLGKFDPKNAPHTGGNQWMGGTGGYNTAGLGGIGGPFRLDAGHDVHQMPDFAKQQVPAHILRKAKEVAKLEYAKKLREINMSDYDASAYDTVWDKVQASSRKLSSVIDQLEAKKKEREWAKHQTSGDLDDGKLIEGVVGEQNIYRRRMDKDPDPGAPQTKPKRLKLCLDVSGSMYRFNGYDQRLLKTLEATLMTMTALDSKTSKVKYDIVGHSGDSPSVSFVKVDEYPKNNKERLDTLKRMMAHTQYCASGDNTVESLQFAIKELSVKKEDYDENVVILVSDANLERYGIHPSELRREMIKDPAINTFVIFIGSLSTEADDLQQQLPAGKTFVLKNTSELPKIMETIFASTIAQ